MLEKPFLSFSGRTSEDFLAIFRESRPANKKSKEVIALFFATQVNMEVVRLFDIHIRSKPNTYAGLQRGPYSAPGDKWQRGFGPHWKLGWAPGWRGSFTGKGNVLREIASGLDLILGCCNSTFLQEVLPCLLDQGHLQLLCPWWPALLRRLHAAEAPPSYLLCLPASPTYTVELTLLSACAGGRIYMCVCVCAAAFPNSKSFSNLLSSLRLLAT